MVGLYDPFDTSYAPTVDDLAAMRQQILGGMTPQLPAFAPQQAVGAPPRPRILFSPSTGQMAAGGVTFDARDIGSISRVPELLQAPQGEDPVGGDWQEITPNELQGYLASLGERRGVLGNLGQGTRQAVGGLLSGVGRGLDMLGAEGAGAAFVSAGEAVGPDEFDQQRSALIREGNTLFENILDAAYQGAPSFVTSILGGGLGGLAVRGAAAALGATASRAAMTAGTFAGSAATIFPMELEGSYQAALRNGFDVNDPQVNQEMLGFALGKTFAQTLAPAMIARGFSPALRGKIDEVGQNLARNRLQYAMGGRTAQGVGIGLTEAMAEGLAEVIDAVSFDPEFRRQLNASDWKAIGPYIVEQYGEDALIAMGAGFLLGGGVGTAVSRQQFTGIADPAADTGPRDLLNDPPAESMDLQGLPAPDAPAGLLPPPTPTDPLALPGPPRALLGPSVMVTPPPVQDAGPIVPPPPGAIPMPGMPEGLEGPVAQGFQQAAAAGPSYVVPTPPAPTPVIEQAPVTQQRTDVPPGAARLRQRPSERGVAAPPVETAETAMAAQLNRLLQQRAEQQATQEAATQQAAAAQQAEADAAVQRQTEASERWDDFRGETGPTLESLPPRVQDAWVDAVAQGEGPRGMPLRRFFDGIVAEAGRRPTGEQQLRRAEREAPAATPEQPVAPLARPAAPAALPEGVVGTATGRPFKNRPSVLAVRNAAKREGVPESRLEPVEVDGGWGLRVLPEETPPTPPPAPKRETLRRKSAAKPAPKAETLKPKKPEPKSAAPAAAPTPAPTRGLTDTERQRLATESAALDRGLMAEGPGRIARRTPKQIEADRQREAQAREAVAQRTTGAPTPAAAPAPATVAEGATPIEALWTEVRSGFPKPELVTPYADLTPEAQAAWDKASKTVEFRQGDAAYKRKKLQKVIDDDLQMQRGPVSGANSLTKDSDEALDLDQTMELVTMIEDYNDAVVMGQDPYRTMEMTETQFRETLRDLIQYVITNNPKARLGNPRTPLLTDLINPDGTFQLSSGGLISAPSRGAFSLNDFTTGRDAVSLDNKPLKPMSTGQAKLVGTKFLSRFAMRPNASYFRDQADLKRKAPELYARAVAARPQGDFDSAQAAGYFFGGNNVIIFTDRIVTADQLRTVIAHEALGHMGIRAVIPEGQVTAVMDSIYNSDEALARIVDEQVEALGLTRAEATEEYLSDMAARIDGSILARWWNAIKDALNKLGLQFRDDEARHLMGQARRYLRTGEQSSFFDPERMATSIMKMNLGRDPEGDGRFALADQQRSGPLDISRTAADSVYAARERPRNVYEAMQNLRDFSAKSGDIAIDARDMWDKFKANAFTPTQWRAQLNEGFSRVYDLIRERYQIATTQIVEFQNMRSISLRPRAELPGGAAVNPKSDAISSAGLAKVGTALAANRIAKSFNYRLPRNLRNQKLFEFNPVSGAYTRTGLSDTLKNQARFTREQFAEGVEVTIEQAMPMTDAFRTKLAEERDALLTGLTDPKEIDRITAEYNALMQAKDYMGESTRVEKITFTDKEWEAFNQELDTMAEAEMRRLHSTLKKYNEERNNTFEVLKRSMKEPMTQGDRSLIDTMVNQYYEIAYGNVDYNDAGMRIAASVDIARAEKFAETLNKVILDAEKVDALFGEGGFLPDASRDKVTEQIKGLKSRLNLPKKQGDTTLDQGRFVVQNQVKQLANELISTTDAERSSMRNLATGYVPFIREGEFQVSMVAVDDKGKTFQMPEQYRQQMLYMQFGSRSDAQAASGQVTELFGDTKFELQVYDPDAEGGRGGTVTKRLKLVPKVGAVKEAATTDPELNLNESIRFLRRFSINLTPSKTEDVIVALMNQNDRALKRRLQAAFVPGQSRDMTKAISQHLETLASVIARNDTAVRLSNVLDIASESSPANELWYGSQEKYDQLKSKYERLKATPGANADQLSIAKQEFTRYHSQFVTNNSSENAMRYYNEARRLMNFLDQQKSVMETDIAAGAVASQARFFTSVALLGGSLATGILNVFGLATNVPAALATQSAQGFGGGFGAATSITTLLQTYKAVGMPGLVPGSNYGEASFYTELSDAELKKMGMTRNEANFLAEGVERGDFRAAQYDALRGTARGGVTSGTAQSALDAWMFWFNATEQSTRRATGLAAYRLEYNRRANAGQSAGEADAAAKKFAYDITNMTLGDYTTANRPAFFRGGLQQFMFMFKQFPVNSAVLLKALPWKGRMMMGLSLLILSGLRGLPFAEDLEDLTDTIMQKMGLKTPSVRAWGIKELDKLVPGLGQFMVSGAANRFLPGDLGVRTALGDIIPGTSIGLAGADVTRELMQLFGPLASTAQSTLSTLDNVIAAANPNTPGSWGTVMRNTPFTMVNAWSDAYAYAQNGAVVDKRGYVVSRDYNAGTILARVLGFYPRAASDQYEAIRMARRVSDYQREISIGYRDAAVRAIVQGNRAEARRIFEAVREWNQSARGSGLEVQNFGDRVQRAVKAQRLLASERLLNASPITARPRMREIMESLGTY